METRNTFKVEADREYWTGLVAGRAVLACYNYVGASLAKYYPDRINAYRESVMKTQVGVVDTVQEIATLTYSVNKLGEDIYKESGGELMLYLPNGEADRLRMSWQYVPFEDHLQLSAIVRDLYEGRFTGVGVTTYAEQLQLLTLERDDSRHRDTTLEWVVDESRPNGALYDVSRAKVGKIQNACPHNYRYSLDPKIVKIARAVLLGEQRDKVIGYIENGATKAEARYRSFCPMTTVRFEPYPSTYVPESIRNIVDRLPREKILPLELTTNYLVEHHSSLLLNLT